MTLMKAYLSVSLFLLYDTNEGLLKIITVRVVCHWWRKVNLILLLFMLYVTHEGKPNNITVLVVWH
jgi:hypothetical protein